MEKIMEFDENTYSKLKDLSFHDEDDKRILNV